MVQSIPKTANRLVFFTYSCVLTLNKGSRGGADRHPAQDGDTLRYGGQVVEQITPSLNLSATKYYKKFCDADPYAVPENPMLDVKVLDSVQCINQCFGSGFSDSARSVDPDPDPGGEK